MDALKININNIDEVTSQLFIDAQEVFESSCENKSMTKVNIITDIGANIVLIKQLCIKIKTSIEMLEDLNGIIDTGK
jgi:hypothetical protein